MELGKNRYTIIKPKLHLLKLQHSETHALRSRQQRLVGEIPIQVGTYGLYCLGTYPLTRGSATPRKMGGRGPDGSEARIFFRG